MLRVRERRVRGVGGCVSGLGRVCVRAVRCERTCLYVPCARWSGSSGRVEWDVARWQVARSDRCMSRSRSARAPVHRSSRLAAFFLIDTSVALSTREQNLNFQRNFRLLLLHAGSTVGIRLCRLWVGVFLRASCCAAAHGASGRRRCAPIAKLRSLTETGSIVDPATILRHLVVQDRTTVAP